ncbi:MAG: ATP-binding protein, partial [Acetobacteraceae bacterium]
PEERASARALRGEVVRDLEVSMRRGTGGRIALLLSAVPLRDRAGRIIGALTAMIDVTQRRAAQDRLDTLLLTLEARVREEVAAREAAQQEAAQAQKMQALGELAGGVAHDFNNVLQAVSGAVGLIERRADSPNEVRRFAAAAAAAAARGAAVAGRLLTFARRGELRATPIEATALLRDTAEMLRHTLGAHVTVRTETAAGAGWLMADLAQLQTVLVNLAANARDAMAGGGTLTLRAVPETVAANATHPAGLRAGRYVRLEAADTGAGMDAATLARATEPFFTTKPVDKGTGLGLAMARGFAEQLGGGLAIASAPGRGTTVRLWLPGADEPAKAPAVRAFAPPVAAPGTPVAGAPDGLHVLLVDDEEGTRTILAEELADCGFVVDQAQNAEEARARLGAARCDVLVTDFSMPGENGLALIAAARNSRPGLPAVLLTGLGADPSLTGPPAEASEGVTETVGKPVRVADLATRIARLAEAGRERAG